MRRLFVREGRLLPAWRVILYLVAFQVAGLLAQLPLGAVLALYAVASGQRDLLIAGASGLPVAILLASSAATLASTLVVTWFFRTRLDGGSLSGLGLMWIRESLRQLAGGMAVGGLAMAGIFAVSWGAGWIASVRLGWGAGFPADLLAAVILLAVTHWFVALSEEIAFRGYVLQNLRLQGGWAVAILGSSLLFAVFHGLNPSFGLGALSGIASAGLFLALGYRVSGALWFPIGLHFAWNTAEGPIFGFPVSGLVTPSLLILEPGPADPLITGGAFGPEAGLLGIGAALLGAIALWLWRPPGLPGESLSDASGEGLDSTGAAL